METENNTSKKEKITEKIKENFDLFIALWGVFLGIFIIYISFAFAAHQQDIGGTILIASAVYIFLRKRLFKVTENFDFKPTRKFIYINNIIFFLALSLSVWFLYTTLYLRPTSYFILIAIACASIAIEILYSDRRLAGLILIKILSIGINLYGGIYYGFPGDIYGADTRFHNPNTERTIEYGYVVPGNSYSYFPIFHILAAQTGILTSLNVHNSIFLSIAFLYTLSSVFIFLLGQKLINTKAGLLAALVFVFGDHIIVFGSQTIPSSLGLFLVAIILYLFIINKPKPLHRRIIIFYFLAVLIITHTIAAFIMLVILIVFYISKYANKYINNFFNSEIALFISTVIGFGVMTFGYWMYAFQCPTCASFFESCVHSLFTAIRDYSVLSPYAVELYEARIYTLHHKSAHFIEYLFNRMGFLLFLGIGIIGAYIWMRGKDEPKFLLSVAMVVLFAFTYGFSLVGVQSIIPSRWFTFIYTILAIVFAYGVFKITNLINKKFTPVLFLIIIFLMCFFMITSTTSNADNPLYYKEGALLFGYRESQLQGISTIHNYFNGTYGAISPYILGTVDHDVLSEDYNFSKDKDKMYIIRKDAFTYVRLWIITTTLGERRGIGDRPCILDEKFKERIELNSNKIYDNGEIWGYVIK